MRLKFFDAFNSKEVSFGWELFFQIGNLKNTAQVKLVS